MYIVDFDGVILAEFDRWDIRSVAKAERFIAERGYHIFKCETTIMGTFVIHVRRSR